MPSDFLFPLCENLLTFAGFLPGNRARDLVPLHPFVGYNCNVCNWRNHFGAFLKIRGWHDHAIVRHNADAALFIVESMIFRALLTECTIIAPFTGTLPAEILAA